MKRILVIVSAVACVYIFAGCGGPHPKLEETKESGEAAGVVVTTDEDAIKAFQDAARQQQAQEAPPAQ